MELIEAFQTLNRATLDVLKQTNVITLHEEQVDDTPYIRAVDKKFILTESIKRHSKVVTAHDLSQYKNIFSSIKIEDKIASWLDALLEDEDESEV